MNEHVSGARIAEQLWARPEGATMKEVIAATGGPQYNKLKALEARGYTVRRVKEGSETRYFVSPPAASAFEATLTAQGQVTIPKDVREHLGLRSGQKVAFVLDEDGRVEVARSTRGIGDLFGILGKPPRGATLEEMDAAIARGAVERYRRSSR